MSHTKSSIARNLRQGQTLYHVVVAADNQAWMDTLRVESRVKSTDYGYRFIEASFFSPSHEERIYTQSFLTDLGLVPQEKRHNRHRTFTSYKKALRYLEYRKALPITMKASFLSTELEVDCFDTEE